MIEQSTPTLGRLPSLDGMRAIAVLLVMYFHAGTNFSGGRAGVDVFFVLSGFLITALLLEEHDKNNRISLRSFYMRRVLRLYPALVATIGVAVVLAAAKMPVFGGSADALKSTVKATPAVLLYFINFTRAFNWAGGGFLGHAWSLAIEEQFYLVWPFVVILLLRKRSEAVVGWVAFGCAVGSAASRTILDLAGVRSELLYNATFSHVDGIFAGCAMAVLWRRRSDLVARFCNTTTSVIAAIVAAVVIYDGRRMSEYGFAVVVLATTLILGDLATHRTTTQTSLLSHPSLVAIGRRSYGLYLYHWPIFLFIGIDTRLHVFALGFIGAFAAAWLSYGLLETPFLRMKHRWSS